MYEQKTICISWRMDWVNEMFLQKKRKLRNSVYVNNKYNISILGQMYKRK